MRACAYTHATGYTLEDKKTTVRRSIQGIPPLFTRAHKHTHTDTDSAHM